MEFAWTVCLTDGTQQSGTFRSTRQVHVTCELHGEILSLRAVGRRPLRPDEKVFMNGYQTWTYCPEYDRSSRIAGTDHIPVPLRNRYHFDRYGDYHFVDYPNKKGVVHGFSWCYFRKEDTFSLIASLNERSGYTMFRYDAQTGELIIEKDCKGLQVDGMTPLFDLFFGRGPEKPVFDAWFDCLQIRPRTRKKLFGYSSWYNRYQQIDEASILEDLEGCRQLLKEGDLFQIDDGWEPYVGDWSREDPVKFPGGMKAVVDAIHEAGFQAGIWLAPFAAETKSVLFRDHPDWFIRIDGQPWCCGCNWSGFYSLDIDKPEVTAYLEEVFGRIFDEWGFDLVKLDFLYAAAPFGSGAETRSGRMYRAMELLRRFAKDKEILGCGVPVMPAFGMVEYCRVSCDVSLDYDDRLYMRRMHRERTSTKQAIGNTIFRRELNGRAFLSDPDVFFLREENLRLKPKQKEDLAVIGALLGDVYLTSDNPALYTEQMRKQYADYRYLAEHAKVLEVRTDGDVVIRYRLDGKEYTYRPGWKGRT